MLHVSLMSLYLHIVWEVLTLSDCPSSVSCRYDKTLWQKLLKGERVCFDVTIAGYITVVKLVWQDLEAAGHIRSMLEAEGNQLMHVFSRSFPPFFSFSLGPNTGNGSTCVQRESSHPN